MEEEYDIVAATEQDEERIAEYLRQHFFQYEPLNMGFEVPSNRPNSAMKFLQCLKEGSSLMAITKSGLIIGVAINGECKRNHKTIKTKPFHESYGRLLNFVDKVEENSDVWKRTGADTSLYIKILSVAPIAGGRGIGKKLVKLSIEIAKSKGFPFIWAMCSSHYSAKICRSLGMESIYRIKYKENKNEAGVPEFLPPAPHTEAHIVMMKFA